MKTAGRVGLFYMLVFIFVALLGGAQLALKIGFGISLMQLAPGLAALVMLRIYKKENVRLTIAVSGAQILKYIGAIGIPLFVSGVLFLSYSRFVAPLRIPPINAISLLIFLVAALLGAFGEELGWRGYLQRILEAKVHLLPASLLVGVLWGAWHVMNYQYGPIYMLFFVLFACSCSVIMAWLLKGTDYNVVIAALFHFMLNVGVYLLLLEVYTDLRLMMLMGLVWVVVAGCIIVFHRKDFLSSHSLLP